MWACISKGLLNTEWVPIQVKGRERERERTLRPSLLLTPPISGLDPEYAAHKRTRVNGGTATSLSLLDGDQDDNQLSLRPIVIMHV